jgi:hypothetical protein
MRLLKLLCVTLLTVSLGRGVRLLPPLPAKMPTKFDPTQSAALFAGVREFDHDSVGEVDYAVDDAINLAWTFAMDDRVSLIDPSRVVLALSGAPRKDKSKEQLRQLLEAGAKRSGASKSELEALLAQQAASVGSGGVFIVGFATHGFSDNGTSYVLASSSLFERDSAIPTDTIRDIAATAPRSLLFFDACRERKDIRAAPFRPPFLDGLTQMAGQVVFTIAGEFAWENREARNGAFTAAIVAGLQCKAPRDVRGFVTVDTLADYSEWRLRKWLQKNRDPNVRAAIRVTIDGDSGSTPLASCALPPPKEPGPAWVRYYGNVITAFDQKGSLLWRSIVSGNVVHTEIADLDGDGAREVVAMVDGKLAILDAKGDLWWTADANTPGNFDGAGLLTISKFAIGELYKKGRQQIVTLSSDTNRRSRVSTFDADGTPLGVFPHQGRLQDLAIGAPTWRHDRKIVVTGENDLRRSCVFLLDPKKVEGTDTQVWYGYVQAASIDGMEIVDRNHDDKRDISLSVPKGHLSLDFEGRTIEAKNAQFVIVK